jgi:hypothetical protein
MKFILLSIWIVVFWNIIVTAEPAPINLVFK